MTMPRSSRAFALVTALVMGALVGSSPASPMSLDAASAVDADPSPLLQPPVDQILVLHGANLPAQPWLAGHRGVDLSTRVGAVVRSPTSGEVLFAGEVAGRGVVVVTVGGTGMRTTLEPVDASVAVGAKVGVGKEIGTVQAGAIEPGVGHCAPVACLHWGLKRGSDYLDPLDWLVGWGPIRLKDVA